MIQENTIINMPTGEGSAEILEQVLTQLKQLGHACVSASRLNRIRRDVPKEPHSLRIAIGNTDINYSDSVFYRLHDYTTYRFVDAGDWLEEQGIGDAFDNTAKVRFGRLTDGQQAILRRAGRTNCKFWDAISREWLRLEIPASATGPSSMPGGFYMDEIYRTVKREDSQYSTPTGINDMNQVARCHLDLKPGDKVRVLFAVPRYTGGWKGEWNPGKMDELVGLIGTFEGHHSYSEGAYVKHGQAAHRYHYPYFCLELVERATSVPHYPRTFESHGVSVNTRGVQVGCQMFSFTAFHELEEYVAKIPKQVSGLAEVDCVIIRGHRQSVPAVTKLLEDLAPVVRHFENK